MLFSNECDSDQEFSSVKVKPFLQSYQAQQVDIGLEHEFVHGSFLAQLQHFEKQLQFSQNYHSIYQHEPYFLRHAAKPVDTLNIDVDSLIIDLSDELLIYRAKLKKQSKTQSGSTLLPRKSLSNKSLPLKTRVSFYEVKKKLQNLKVKGDRQSSQTKKAKKGVVKGGKQCKDKKQEGKKKKPTVKVTNKRI